MKIAAKTSMELSLAKATLLPPSPERTPPSPRGVGSTRFALGNGGAAWLLMAFVLGLGLLLRIYPSSGFDGIGYDENIYRAYVQMAQRAGLSHYGAVVTEYVQWQEKRPDAVVPATRVGFLWPAAALAELSGLPPNAALRLLSLLASVLLLFATAVIGYRLGGIERMLVVTALMAVAPLQIHLAQRSLIDGYFAFWAVLCAWFLWESLQAPRARGWLAAYGASLVILVLTKENAAFVFFALMATLGLLYAFRRQSPTWPLLVVSVLAPSVAVMGLSYLVGGIGEWITFYRMFVEKSHALPYPIQFQDGTWYRYLVDFILLSPCVVLCAAGRVFSLHKEDRVDIFWVLFLGCSFVLMSSVTNGMSLRFAAYWDEPLRWLAASQVILLANRFRRVRPALIMVAAVALLAAVDLSQYSRFFVQSGIYDPVSAQLLHSSKLIK